MNKIKNVSVVGLGKLGSPLAACLAYKGFNVLGFDLNKNFVDLINKGRAPVVEPQLQELITASKNRLKATTNPNELIEKTQITFLIVPTPSQKNGTFTDKYLKDSLKSLSVALRSKKDHHIFVITSTVSPETTEKSLIPHIEKYSGKKVNKDFSVCYNPEFIALGDVVNGMLRPDMLLIGESSKKVGDVLEEIYKKTCENSPTVARMSLVSAEIAKISLNSYVTMKISFANTLGNICERIPGANADDVTRALGADRRVSPFYLKSGLSFGGPCFPRDNRAFRVFARQFGINAKLAKATDEINDFQIENSLDKISNFIKKSGQKSVSILGLAYKTKTPVIEESPAVKAIDKMLKKYRDVKISVYDSLAMENVRAIFGDKIHYAKTMDDCLSQSSFWVITTPELQFKKIKKSHIKQNPTAVIDYWRLASKLKGDNRVIFI